jgi:hypothetical protein
MAAPALTERNAEVCRMVRDGMRPTEVAELFQMTKQRVSQILAENDPKAIEEGRKVRESRAPEPPPPPARERRTCVICKRAFSVLETSQRKTCSHDVPPKNPPKAALDANGEWPTTDDGEPKTCARIWQVSRARFAPDGREPAKLATARHVLRYPGRYARARERTSLKYLLSNGHEIPPKAKGWKRPKGHRWPPIPEIGYEGASSAR